MSDWNEVKLSDFVHIKHGYAFKGKYFSDEPTDDYLVTPGNFLIGGGFKRAKFKYYAGPIPDEYVLSPDDLVVTMTDLSKLGDTLGYSALIPQIPGKTLLHNQRIGLVEFQDDGLDKVFTYFLLRTASYRHHVLSSASGSTVKHTSPSKITSFRFRKPPISTQIEIGKKLIAIEKKIVLNGEINQTLEQIAKEIFNNWFVDFEPVKAKQHIRVLCGSDEQTERAAQAVIAGAVNLDVITAATDISALDKELTEALSEKLAHQTDAQREQLTTIASHFPDQLVDSELGLVPEGWNVRGLDEIANFLNGVAAQKFPPKHGEPSLPVIKIGEMRNGLSAKTGRASQNADEKYFVNNGDLLFSWSASLLVQQWSLGQGLLNQHIFKVTSDEFPKWFCHQWICYHLKRFQQIAAGKAVTMGHIKRSHLSEAKTLVPTSDLIDLGTEVVGAMLERELQNSLESGRLGKLRDLLVPKLLSGELVVGRAA